jgi:hypothetical protein
MTRFFDTLCVSFFGGKRKGRFVCAVGEMSWFVWACRWKSDTHRKRHSCMCNYLMLRQRESTHQSVSYPSSVIETQGRNFILTKGEEFARLLTFGKWAGLTQSSCKHISTTLLFELKSTSYRRHFKFLRHVEDDTSLSTEVRRIDMVHT